MGRPGASLGMNYIEKGAMVIDPKVLCLLPRWIMIRLSQIKDTEREPESEENVMCHSWIH